MTKAVTPPPAAPSRVHDLTAELSVFAAEAFDPKAWHKSLTLRGTALAMVVAPWVAAKGALILSVFGVNPQDAADLADAAATVLRDLGGALIVIGRVRLGGLK